MKDIDGITKIIGYSFYNSKLLEQALTRRGYAKEMEDKETPCEHQLKFTTLGDAVLKVILVELLKDQGLLTPGEITEKKSHMENKKYLAKMGLWMEIWDHIIMDKGEKGRGPKAQKRIMGETMEALIGAIFLDSTYETTKQVVDKWYRDFQHEDS